MLRFTPPHCAGERDEAMITSVALQAETVNVWMGEIAAAVRAESEHLTQLDSAIGDGDHGINMNRAVDGVVELGAAAPGDKTMVDALAPAVDTLRERVASGDPPDLAAAAAAKAAEDGARATVPMQARKGRASYLGPRSIGHQDPGATSATIILAALANAVAAEG